MQTTVHPMRRVAAFAAACALVLAACSSDDDNADGTEPDDEAAAAEVADGDGDGNGNGDEVEVVFTDYAFEGIPDTVAAGTQFTIVNEADDELHELVAFRLPDDEDRSVEELTELAPEELVGALGEPATVLIAEPGGPTIPAVGDGTLTEPGRYAIMCFIPTGVDPQEYMEAAEQTEEGPPQIENAGPPHFVHGMHAELTVE